MLLYTSNLNLNVMNIKANDLNPEDLKPYYEPDSKILGLLILFACSGIIVAILWLCLFVAGLLIDSSYYRAAISYKFAGLSDWVIAIITFTFSNVILLAFMSGLLGGITSKMLYTKGFKITKYGYRKANAYQIENPFISAFRGMFVFIAILFMQYVSTFSDLGAINKIPREEETQLAISYEKLYATIVGKEKDTAIVNVVRKEMDKMMAETINAEPDTSLINRIIRLKADLRKIGTTDAQSNSLKNQKKAIKARIKSMRRTLKVPSDSDFSGIGLSSFSYFKFAVIVSFLAFAFGYDPSLFADFFSKIFKKLDKDTPDENAGNPKE